MTRRLELMGRRFGRLKVVGLEGKNKHGNYLWRTVCDCGVVKIIAGTFLVREQEPTRSCGCLRRELGRASLTTHGESYLSGHSSFRAAKQRCSQTSNNRYADYGGRGIEFRFQNFAEFIKELGPKPSPKHSLDRIDVDGHYEPGNVRWATALEQNRNQRRSGAVKQVVELKSQIQEEKNFSRILLKKVAELQVHNSRMLLASALQRRAIALEAR